MLIYNTRTHKKQELKPLVPGHIRMYVCGPTVYDQIHTGNGRTFLSFDVIRRYLIFKGYTVTFAQNLTDIDDKIINRAQERGISTEEVASRYSAAFIEQMHRFGVLDPDIRPCATGEIESMLEMIAELIEKGHAYAVESGDVYFSVRSCKTYGTIAGRKLDDLLAGARIEENSEKRDPYDFALWKSAKPGEPSWESKWGKGRPGWHTECAAMVHRYLGCPIDIHGGGSDLIFPHHENEAAQVQCCWDEELAHVWMHTGMLLVDGEKMSKSLGNFYTLKEVLDAYSADVVRLLMLQTHYRSPLDFSFKRLDGTVNTFDRIKECIENLRWASQENRGKNSDSNSYDRSGSNLDDSSESTSGGKDGASDFTGRIEAARTEFIAQMDDDFNTAGALAAIFSLITDANTYLNNHSKLLAPSAAKRCAEAIVELLGVLGIESIDVSQTDFPPELVDLARRVAGYEGTTCEEAASVLLAARTRAREAKNWGVADAIRDGVRELGLVIEDTAMGPRLKDLKEASR